MLILSRRFTLLLIFLLLPLLQGCRSAEFRQINTTAYCGCGQCCNWTRGNWWLLKMNFWSKHIKSGKNAGEPYSGLTASGTKPRMPRPGLLSVDTLVHPWMLPPRLVLPWLWLPRKVTIAADTAYYPFGTEMYVPGWGWGVVEDRGSAIKGPDRVDVFFKSHGRALEWGRRRVEATIMVSEPKRATAMVDIGNR